MEFIAYPLLPKHIWPQTVRWRTFPAGKGQTDQRYSSHFLGDKVLGDRCEGHSRGLELSGITDLSLELPVVWEHVTLRGL